MLIVVVRWIMEDLSIIDSEKNRNLGSQRSRSPSSLAKEVVDKMFKNSSVEMMAKHFRDLNVEVRHIRR